MKEHITIGIDPSVNSTGICVSGNGWNKYYLFPSKITKKSLEWSKNVEWLNINEYEKTSINNIKKYHEKEFIKFNNLATLIQLISITLDSLINDYDIDYVTMEGVSYGSVSGAALVDLAFLNAMIRLKLHEKNLKFYIVAPTEIKKYAIGNGGAEKNLIVMSWKKLDKNTQSIPDYFKCDDLADAYFMAHYNPEISE